MNLILGAVTIFQYLFTSWVMIVALEGIFIKFDNAGIEGNLAVLILYLTALIGNGVSVFMIGEPELLKLNRREDE